MLSLHKNPRRLAALGGLLLALAAAPTAAAVPILPDGGYESDPQLTPAPAVHSSANSLEWSDVALAGAVALIAFAIAIALLVAARRRRPVIASWSRPAESGNRPAPLRF